MKYNTATAFNMAISEMLRKNPDNHLRSRIRKQIVFTRFLERLGKVAPGDFVLKGGVSMQVLLPGVSRFTSDLDLHVNTMEPVRSILENTVALELGDFFEFYIQGPPESLAHDDTVHDLRYTFVAFLGNKRFEQFHIDLGTQDIMFPEPETRHCRTIYLFQE